MCLLRRIGAEYIPTHQLAARLFTPEVYSTARWLQCNLPQTIQDQKFDLELDAIDTRLQRALQVEHPGALDAEKCKVQHDDQDISVDQLP